MSSKYLFVFASLWVFSCAEITIPERSDAGKDQGIEDAAEEEAAGEDVDAIDIFPEVDIPVQECNSDADCASITVEVCQRVFCNMTKKKCEVKFSEYGTPCFAVALTIGECEESRCDGNGECKIYPAGEETPCEFDDLCKRGKCKSGECKPGDPVECNDGNECTDDSCESDKGCVFLKVSEKPCSQSNPCMEGAMCVEGVCQGHPKICGDTNICTDDYCNEKTGECEYQGNSNPCDDGNKCTNDDYCSDGDCIGGVILFCKDDNFCTDDYCDKETGQCKFANNTLACNDDNICTLNDKCSGGVCLGTMDKCDDLNPCTQDGCDPLKDGCWHKTIPNCLNCTSDTQCNDNNVCTKEACDSNKCNYENLNNAQCEDGNKCTLNDYCMNGACNSGTGILKCSDNNTCTSDSCDPQLGCVYTNNNASCEDGNSCTVNDYCENGVCKSGLNTCCSGKPDGYSCTDQNNVTSPDLCFSGVCKGFYSAAAFYKYTKDIEFAAAGFMGGYFFTAGSFVQMSDVVPGEETLRGFIAKLNKTSLPSINSPSYADWRKYTSLHSNVAVGDQGLIAYFDGQNWSIGGPLQQPLFSGTAIPGNLAGVWGRLKYGLVGCNSRYDWFIVGRDEGNKYAFSKWCSMIESGFLPCQQKWGCSVMNFEKFMDAEFPAAVYGDDTSQIDSQIFAVSNYMKDGTPMYNDVFVNKWSLSQQWKMNFEFAATNKNLWKDVYSYNPDSHWACGTNGLIAYYDKGQNKWIALSDVLYEQKYRNFNGIYSDGKNIYVVGSRVYDFNKVKEHFLAIHDLGSPHNDSKYWYEAPLFKAYNECETGNCPDFTTTNEVNDITGYDEEVYIVGKQWDQATGVQKGIVFYLVK